MTAFSILARSAPLIRSTHEITETGHYAAMVCAARRRRRLFDASQIAGGLSATGFQLAMRLGFRPVDGCAERVVYRQLFPSACDPLDGATGRFHFAAQREMRDLYALLQLPTNDRARRRASARAEWFQSAALPFAGDDLIAE